jgi:hypothetical protein
MSPKRSDDNSQRQPNKRAHIRKVAWLLAAFAVLVYLTYIVYLVVT